MLQTTTYKETPTFFGVDYTKKSVARKVRINYSTFGMQMQGRSFTSESYRYGYQGSEKDGEVNSGMYTTEFRALDVRLGRWFTPDPITQPWSSPYVSMENSPITLTDVMGLKGGPVDCETFGQDGGGSNNVPILPGTEFANPFVGSNVAGAGPKMGRAAGQVGLIELPEVKGTPNVDYGPTDETHFNYVDRNIKGGVWNGKRYYQDPNLPNGTGGYYWVKESSTTSSKKKSGEEETPPGSNDTPCDEPELPCEEPKIIPKKEKEPVITPPHANDIIPKYTPPPLGNKLIPKPTPIAPTGLLYMRDGSSWMYLPGFNNQVSTWINWFKSNPDYNLEIFIGGSHPGGSGASWDDKLGLFSPTTYRKMVDDVSEQVRQQFRKAGVLPTRFKILPGNLRGSSNPVKWYR